MAAKPLPSQEVLRQLLDYDPETGTLTWRERPLAMFTGKTEHSRRRCCATWNARFAGKPALTCLNAYGYPFGGINGRLVIAHRVIWKWMTGTDPEHQIDHINSVRDDNRWANLRAVSHAQNQQNTKRSKNNRSGHCGVHFLNRCQRWGAEIGGRKLGTFADKADAIAARQNAERLLGYHPTHGRK